MPFHVSCRHCGTRFEAVKVNNDFAPEIPQDMTYSLWIEWCAVCRELEHRRPRRAVAGDILLEELVA